MTRADLHRLVDELPEEALASVATLLEWARDPAWAAHLAAPFDDEPVTEADLAAIEEGRQEPGISLEEFLADLS